MKIYAFRYCYCIYESALAAQSLHMNYEKAVESMNDFVESRKKEVYFLYEDDPKYKLEDYEAWDVIEMWVQE